MIVYFHLVSIIIISLASGKSETEFTEEEPQTEIEYQPIDFKPLNESSEQEVSTQPLPAEPVHPQVVVPGSEAAINPVPSPQRPPVQLVVGKAAENGTETLTPPPVEPEPPVIQPALILPSTTVSASECHKVLDLGILMDSSYTISPSIWEEEKSIVVTLMNKLDISPPGTHMSVMTFNTDVDFPIPFTGYKDADDLKRKITQLPYHTGWSRTDLGLTAVKDRMFVPQAGARDIRQVPRTLVVFTNGKTDGSLDQNVNWTQRISQAADALRRSQVKIVCVQIGEAMNQDLITMAGSSSLVFAQTDIKGLSGMLFDMSGEMCNNEGKVVHPAPLPVTTQLPAPVTSPLPTPAPYPAPRPVPYPAPVPQPARYPVAAAVPAGSCQIPQCTYPSVCISAAIYHTCVAPTSSAAVNNTCSTPGPCLTTLTTTATDTTTLTNTQTQTNTAVVTLTSTETTTKTNTARTTQTDTRTDVVTTTNTEAVTSTHYTTETSTAVLTSHVPFTSTKTLTTTSVGVVNTTNTHTLTSTAVVKTTATETSTATVNTTNTALVTSTHHETKTSTAVATSTATAMSTAVVTETATSTHVATSTAVVTSVANKTNTHTLTTTNTDFVTSTKLATSTHTETATTTLTTTSTGVATSTAVTTATKTNTVNATQFATETLIQTLTTLATDKTTVTHNATNVITATTTSTATATSTAVLTATSTAKITETLTATSTAVQTQTLTNTLNHTLTQTKTLTATSTKVVTTCSSNCTKIEPTPSPSTSSIVPTTITPTTPPPGGRVCATNYTKLGCFVDDRKNPRPLPELIFTDRDAKSRVYSGITVDWNNWNTYMVDLVCRCANATKAKKYSHFSIQYYGECWSGADAAETYNRAGMSEKCVTTNYTKCDPTDKIECVGEKNVNFVYGIDIGEPGGRVTPTQPPPTPTTPTPTETSPTPPVTPSCNEALDVGVIIDSSDSITLEDYNFCLQFVADLTKSFKVSAQGTHFGAIVYSSTPQLQFSFADARYYKPKRLRKAIKKFPYVAEGTRTDLALSLANMELFSEQGGDRADKPNVLIVITDGRTNPISSQPYSEVLQPLQAKNVRILAVGVGSDVDKKELKTIAMDDPNHVFRVKRYKDLVKILNTLLKESCHEAPTVAPPTVTRATSPPQTATPPPLNNRKCNIEYQKIGCFVDKQVNNPVLALPEKMINESDMVNWDTWNVWLPDFACRCANIVYEMNYHIFGIHNYGECWSGKNAANSYNAYGASEQCINTRQQPCDVSSVGECAGDQNSNYVYRIVISQGAQIQPSPVPPTAVQQGQLEEDVYGNCPVDVVKKGCFNDLRNPRPLPKLMFTDLDNSTAEYSGFPVDWGSWDGYLDDVVCRCAQVSKTKGFTYFGIENFGECWSGVNTGKMYSKDGSSEFCITKEFAQCHANDRNSCCGNKTTTFVYNIRENFEVQQEEACFTQFENVGCYADKQVSPHPVQELIFTDMDKNSPKYSGIEAKLGELDTYLGNVLCRCAEQAQELGYEYFGVQNHGECYSGSNPKTTYSKDGPSKQCITRDFKECPAITSGNNRNQEDCVGVQGSNYVYRIINIELGDEIKRKDASKMRLRKRPMANRHGG